MISKKKIHTLDGFIKKDTITKYIKKNIVLTKKNSYYNIQKIVITIVLFCSISFLLHIYQLFSKKKDFDYLSIVPRSGLY